MKLALGALRAACRSAHLNCARWLGIELIQVSVTEKVVSALGGGLAILLLISISASAVSRHDIAGVVGSMGASAVLLFAVPHGQLSQPWPVIGGQFISALIGVACARVIPNSTVAAACAVGLSIGVMYQLKCIHPPGGATAFTAVLGGSSIAELGFVFAVFPVLINAMTMVLLAVVINGPFSWRRYPAILSQRHRAVVSAREEARKHEEILIALRAIDSFVDITEDDLVYLAELLSKRA